MAAVSGASEPCTLLRSMFSPKSARMVSLSAFEGSVAPMILPEVARDALLGYTPGSALSEYMLGAWEVADPMRRAFSGCLHADGTVRAQVVSAGSPQLGHIHDLLRRLRAEHQIQGVINTSFNQRGVPIAHQLESGLSQAEAMGLDAVWLPPGM